MQEWMRTKLHRVLIFLCSFGDLPSTRARVTIPPTDYLTSFLPFSSPSFLNRVPSLSCLPVPSMFQVCSTSTNVPSSLSLAAWNKRNRCLIPMNRKEGTREGTWNKEQGRKMEPKWEIGKEARLFQFCSISSTSGDNFTCFINRRAPFIDESECCVSHEGDKKEGPHGVRNQIGSGIKGEREREGQPRNNPPNERIKKEEILAKNGALRDGWH